MKKFNGRIFRVGVWKPGMCLPICQYCDLWGDCEELTRDSGGRLPCHEIQKPDYYTRYFKLVVER